MTARHLPECFKRHRGVKIVILSCKKTNESNLRVLAKKRPVEHSKTKQKFYFKKKVYNNNIQRKLINIQAKITEIRLFLTGL